MRGRRRIPCPDGGSCALVVEHVLIDRFGSLRGSMGSVFKDKTVAGARAPNTPAPPRANCKAGLPRRTAPLSGEGQRYWHWAVREAARGSAVRLTAHPTRRSPTRRLVRAIHENVLHRRLTKSWEHQVGGGLQTTCLTLRDLPEHRHFSSPSLNATLRPYYCNC
jgi:hypothetical protein